MLFRVLVLSIITLSIFGCSSDSDSSNLKKLTISDAESIVNVVMNSARTSINISNIKGISSSRSREFKELETKVVSCQEGSVSRSGGYELNKDKTINYYKLVMDMDNCVEDGLKKSGKITIESIVSENSIKISFTDSFSIFDESSNSSSLSKIDDNSFIEIKNIDEFIETTVGMVFINSSGLKTGSRELVYRVGIDSNGIKFFPISGVDGIEYLDLIVDESYDASRSPMVMSYRGELLKGGLFKYIDSLGSKIELEAIDKNLLLFRVDSNRDGEFDNSETIEVAIVNGKAVAKKRPIDKESTPEQNSKKSSYDWYDKAAEDYLDGGMVTFLNDTSPMVMDY